MSDTLKEDVGAKMIADALNRVAKAIEDSTKLERHRLESIGDIKRKSAGRTSY